jgi:hypothetical protein
VEIGNGNACYNKINVEHFTANAVNVTIGDNGNRLIFEIWWNFFYDLFSIKNVADANIIDSFVIMILKVLNSENLNTSIGNIISR